MITGMKEQSMLGGLSSITDPINKRLIHEYLVATKLY